MPFSSKASRPGSSSADSLFWPGPPRAAIRSPNRDSKRRDQVLDRGPGRTPVSRAAPAMKNRRGKVRRSRCAKNASHTAASPPRPAGAASAGWTTSCIEDPGRLGHGRQPEFGRNRSRRSRGSCSCRAPRPGRHGTGRPARRRWRARRPRARSAPRVLALRVGVGARRGRPAAVPRPSFAPSLEAGHAPVRADRRQWSGPPASAASASPRSRTAPGRRPGWDVRGARRSRPWPSCTEVQHVARDSFTAWWPRSSVSASLSRA